MKHVLVTPGAALALLALGARAAAADPAPAPDLDAEPRGYLAAGMMAGPIQIEGGQGGLQRTLGFEGGHLLGAGVWGHVMVAPGGFASFDRYSGTYLALRIGAELHRCARVWLCVRGGVDGGVLRVAEIEMENPAYGVRHTSPGVFARVGIDVGGAMVRGLLTVDVGGAIPKADDVADLTLGILVRL